MKICPCGSEKDYEICCNRYISGEKKVPTAESLMRSRYSAYVNNEVKYLLNTLLPEKQDDGDEDTTREWSESADWEKLEIINTSAGLENDEEGTVEFKAFYAMNGIRNIHHEMATFKKIEGTWYFEDGKIVQSYPGISVKPNIGRNEPCYCGSGKKYKKCCYGK